MPLRYYGALYPTPSPCAAVEPLRRGVYWSSENDAARQPADVAGAVPADQAASARVSAQTQENRA
jgi:hypothetical protein